MGVPEDQFLQPYKRLPAFFMTRRSGWGLKPPPNLHSITQITPIPRISLKAFRSLIPASRSQILRSQISDTRSQLPEHLMPQLLKTSGLSSQMSGHSAAKAFSPQLSAPRFQISDLRSPISDLRSQISDLRSQISDLRTQISAPRPQISDLRILISEL